MARRRWLGWIAVALALGVVVLGVVRYKRLEAEKARVDALLKATNDTLQATRQEKEQVTTELTAATAELATATTHIDTLQGQLTEAHTHLGQLESQLKTLEEAQAQLQQEKTTLTSQVGGLTQQKAALEARLGSLVELHNAITEVKRRLHEERVQARLAEIEAFKKADAERLKHGNRGFFVKNGVPTILPTVAYRVRVLPVDNAANTPR